MPLSLLSSLGSSLNKGKNRIPGPTNLSATATGANSATLTFTAPSVTGTITGYTATSPQSASFTQVRSGTTITISSGLATNTGYTFTVVAINAGGTSVDSSASNSITTQSTLPT